MEPPEIESQIESELEDVIDPCSCFTENPISVVKLGLVDDVTVENGVATIELVLTSPMCTYFLEMSTEITEKVEKIDGVSEVEVTENTDDIWTRQRMTKETRDERRTRFREEMKQEGITPKARTEE